jgi:hypothetical protein
MQQADIVVLARNAGLSAENAVTASAVAMAESGGNERQITRDSDDESYGLWQINMLGAMGPSRRLLYGLKSNTDLLDPVVNAHVMSAISHQGNSWSAWGAYTNGSYKKFLPTSSSSKAKLLGKLLGGAADVAGDVKAAGGAVADVATSAGQAIDALQRAATWTSQPKNWLRVAYVVGGGVLVVAALVKVVSEIPAGKAAIGPVKKAVTKGLK